MNESLFTWLFPFLFGIFFTIFFFLLSLYYEWCRLWCLWLPPIKPSTAPQGPPDLENNRLRTETVVQNNKVGREAAGADKNWPVPPPRVVLRQDLDGRR